MKEANINIKSTTKGSDNLSELVYQRIKNDIFDFKLMPGERFTESEVAKAYDVSRTPIRQALYCLQQEGYVDVSFFHASLFHIDQWFATVYGLPCSANNGFNNTILFRIDR